MINVGGDEDYFGGASRSQLLSTSAEEVAAGGSVADLLVNKRRPTMLPSGIRRLIARASLASRGQSISPRLKEKNKSLVVFGSAFRQPETRQIDRNLRNRQL